MNVKYLTTLGLMLLLGVALAARQGTNNANPDDPERNRRAPGRPSASTTADKAVTADKADANEQKEQSEIKALYHGKLSLSLGSMPCPPDDKKCSAREKDKFPPQEEHP